MMLSQSNNQITFKSTLGSKKSHSDLDYMDEDYSDYVVKNEIPEMKLLQMDYIHKASSPTSQNSHHAHGNKVPCKCSGGTSVKSSPVISMNKEAEAQAKQLTSKYLVYKKKHSIFGASSDSSASDIKNDKLKYVADGKKQGDAKGSQSKRKYLIFDSKKQSSSKLDSIQYYFDNKSYEKYVDNKLYGIIQQKQQHFKDDKVQLKPFENKSKSWEYRDNSKTESKLKLFEIKQPEPPKSAKSEASSSGASSGESSDVSLKRRNCRLKQQMRFTTSKSISDLTERTSSDVSRINQLFANAKTIHNPAGMFDKEKYKIHRKLNDYNVDVKSIIESKEKMLSSKDHMRKYHRSSTELNIKPLAVTSHISKTPPPFTNASSSPSSCGYKNCKFPNCPVSTNSSTSSAFSSCGSDKSCSKLAQLSGADSNKAHSHFVKSQNGENLKTNISVNGKNNIIINDTKSNLILHEPNFHQSKSPDIEFSKRSDNKTTIKINESCFIVNQNHDVKSKGGKLIELNTEKVLGSQLWDKNIKVKNNPPVKYDSKVAINNKIRNEANSVKIYVIGNDSTTSTTSTSSSSSNECSDSDKDYGYFDQSSQGRSSSPEFVKMVKSLNDFCKMNSKQLGCDATMFWNNSYFHDEEENDATLRVEKTAMHGCNKCSVKSSEDILHNYICICRNKVEFIF